MRVFEQKRPEAPQSSEPFEANRSANMACYGTRKRQLIAQARIPKFNQSRGPKLHICPSLFISHKKAKN